MPTHGIRRGVDLRHRVAAVVGDPYARPRAAISAGSPPTSTVNESPVGRDLPHRAVDPDAYPEVAARHRPRQQRRVDIGARDDAVGRRIDPEDAPDVRRDDPELTFARDRELCGRDGMRATTRPVAGSIRSSLDRPSGSQSEPKANARFPASDESASPALGSGCARSRRPRAGSAAAPARPDPIPRCGRPRAPERRRGRRRARRSAPRGGGSGRAPRAAGRTAAAPAPGLTARSRGR